MRMVNRQQRGQADGFSTELGTHPARIAMSAIARWGGTLWESATRRYAIEHTRVDAFEGQADREPSKNRCLLVPVKIALADRLSGWFGLSVREVDVAATSSSSRCLDDRSASGAGAFLVAVWWRS